MKKKIFKLILVTFIIAGTVVSTLSFRKIIGSIQDEKKTVNDSIALLNRLLVNENQKYINVMIALDSISRKGGVLGFTNFKGKTFELNLIPK